MSGIVTQGAVRDYISCNPGSTPIEIADALDVPVCNVKARLMSLLYKNTIHRIVNKSRLDSMFYYPSSEPRITRSG